MTDPLTASLDHEVRAEKAGTLGRLLERLDTRLENLRTVADNADPEEHDRILQDAADALWHVVIQRELCGFGQTQRFLRDRNVPAAVQSRMGISKASRNSA
ncbi:MAG: DUF6665 family protein [Pseudomonadota bacterium]